MDRWSEHTKCWYRWLGNWVESGRQTGLGIYQNWCMLTTPWDWLSLDTAHTTWCLGDNHAYPSTFIFPLLWAPEGHWNVNQYLADLHEWLDEAFKEVQTQSTSEAEKQRQYYDHKANAISLEPGDLVLVKVDAYKGRRKVKDQWEEELY